MTKGDSLPGCILYTDGGAAGANGNAASACVIEDHLKKKRYLLLGYLAEATNNEAEIFAVLLGLFFVQKLKYESKEKIPLKIVADSEYVLKSAEKYIINWQTNGWKTADKKPVKNKNLWQLYLHLAEKFKLKFEHVYGHQGHEQNEACDLAVQWAKENAEEIFYKEKSVVRAELETGLKNKSWLVFDLRKVIKAIREDSFSPEEENELSKMLDLVFKGKGEK